MPYKKQIVKFINLRLGLSGLMAMTILLLNSSITSAANLADPNAQPLATQAPGNISMPQ
jgi:hypothetical protein